MSAKLPDVVPTHWNIAGQPDQFGSKALDLWLMPGVELFMIGLTLAFATILSPRRYEVARFAATFELYHVSNCGDGSSASPDVVIVRAAAGSKFDMTSVVFTVLFLFLMGIGNVLGKVKQNFFVGVRTPWTLKPEPAVWDRTHREAGHLWLVGGLLGAIMAIVGVNPALLIGYLLVMALIPVVRSFIWYRRLVQPGGGGS